MKKLWNALPTYPSRGANAAMVAMAFMLGPLMAIVVGCSSSTHEVPNGGDTSIGLQNPGAHFWLDLGNGTKLECWYVTQNYGNHSATGGPTCDWDAYNATYRPGLK